MISVLCALSALLARLCGAPLLGLPDNKLTRTSLVRRPSWVNIFSGECAGGTFGKCADEVRPARQMADLDGQRPFSHAAIRLFNCGGDRSQLPQLPPMS